MYRLAVRLLRKGISGPLSASRPAGPGVLNNEYRLETLQENVKMSENEVKVSFIQTNDRIRSLEERVIALERGLEALIRRLEESSGPDDEPGWYGRPE